METPTSVVIFGASGDLTARKLMPSLFALWRAGALSPKSLIVGAARRPVATHEFRDEMYKAVLTNGRVRPNSRAEWDGFARCLHYLVVDFDEPDHFSDLRLSLESFECDQGLAGNRVFYLAVTPGRFASVIRSIREAGLVHEPGSKVWSRVVIEKPFGTDLASARALNAEVTKHLAEEQIYRIDHYLGKDTVQNLLAFRFGNGMFEPLFDHHHVDHVQVTVAETVGMTTGRGAFYDATGALRDVLQNHVLQLLALIAMEPPTVAGAKEIRDEKVKVLQCLHGDGPDVASWAVRGQYGPGTVDGQEAIGYREEGRVAQGSRTETYVAVRARIDNWRWSGVPFILRAGKRLAARQTEIVVVFDRPPLQYFRTVRSDGDLYALSPSSPNALVFRIQPDEGISLRLCVKRPGMNMELYDVAMQFSYAQAFPQALPDAYERLLIDILRGDQTLFTRSDEIERAWEFVDPIMEHFSSVEPEDFPNYPSGTWGPVEAERLLTGCATGWWNSSRHGPR